MVESKVFGVLIVARQTPESFSSLECEFLRQLSEHAALASHQAHLYGALQKAYEELRQSQQTVMQQERLRALGQMASGIAHDINNAISPACLYTEFLLEKETTLSKRARDYLQIIAHAIEDVAATVARMREFSRQREPDMTLVRVQLNRALQQVMDLTRVRWNDMPQQQGIVIQIRSEFSPDLPEILGVEGEVREALTNLFLNAFDAMPEGGILTLRTRKVDDISVHLEVSDTGTGMSEETRQHCLEPFYTTKGERGTGLGLAMVYGVAKRHGALVEIESELGKGTLMRLIFPIPVGSDKDLNLSAQPPKALPPLRILVIDDDALILKSLENILTEDGHSVVTANTGSAGIDAFMAALRDRNPFEMVITDLGMPYTDGRKVAAKIKEASPATPVILLTGWGQRLLEDGDIPAHVDQVLSKPPKPLKLRETIAKCLSLAPVNPRA
jgi:signal transduction histidine kinase